jgi:nuclear transport factor 2 (NTF2) superfamily protein
MSKLTGETRYRLYKPAFMQPKLVLQVQYNYTYTTDTPYDYDSYTSRKWRDATFEDLQELGMEESKCS